jgi:hypothetical protein
MSCCCVTFQFNYSGGTVTTQDATDTGRTYGGKCVFELSILVDQPNPETLYIWWNGQKGWVITKVPEGQPSTPTSTIAEGVNGDTNDCPSSINGSTWNIRREYDAYLSQIVSYECISNCCCFEIDLQISADVTINETIGTTVFGEYGGKCVWSFVWSGQTYYIWNDGTSWWITQSEAGVNPKVGIMAGLESQTMDCPLSELSPVDWFFNYDIANITGFNTEPCPEEETCTAICGQICFAPFE